MAKKDKKTTAATAPEAKQPGGVPSGPDPAAKSPAPDPLAEETIDLHPGDVIDENLVVHRAVPPEEQAIAGNPPPEVVSRGTENDPTATLKQVVLGMLGPEATVAGALISVRPRPTKWRDAIALRVSKIVDGVVFIDVHLGDYNTISDVPYGDDVRCWKFRTE